MTGALAVFFAPVAVAVAWSVRRPSERQLHSFAHRYGLVPDEANRPFLALRLRTARCWRAPTARSA